MNKELIWFLGCFVLLTSCKQYQTIHVIIPSKSQIVANHTIVDEFDNIPQYYLDQVKKMMVYFPGESHSSAYREGMTLLQSKYPEYKCYISTGEPYTDQYLRVNSGSSIGEEEWFTWYAYPFDERPLASNTIKNLISEYNDLGHSINLIGFGWCWDAFYEYSRLVRYRDILRGDRRILPDPEYGVHWCGTSQGGPDGIRVWGLDSADIAETGNKVSTDTYLFATQEYIDYCTSYGYPTKVIFTTGPADRYTGESGYQGYLKHQYIRNYVAADSSRILFDYNDILCYDDDGKVTTSTWEDHTYPVITARNLGDGSIGHISPEGAIRLAKAQWWMLARIAGWDGK